MFALLLLLLLLMVVFAVLVAVKVRLAVCAWLWGKAVVVTVTVPVRVGSACLLVVVSRVSAAQRLCHLRPSAVVCAQGSCAALQRARLCLRQRQRLLLMEAGWPACPRESVPAAAGAQRTPGGSRRCGESRA